MVEETPSMMEHLVYETLQRLRNVLLDRLGAPAGRLLRTDSLREPQQLVFLIASKLQTDALMNQAYTITNETPTWENV